MELRLVFSILFSVSEHQTLVLISSNALVVLCTQMYFCNRHEWSYVSDTKRPHSNDNGTRLLMNLVFKHAKRIVGFLVAIFLI